MSNSELPLSPIQLNDIAKCEQLIGYEFVNKRLLAAALTHASGALARLQSNERLEFLGDSVLGFVVCDVLYRRFPEALEGELTRIKSTLVSRHACLAWAQAWDLQSVLQVGRGITQRGVLPQSILADMFEAIVGAVYLDAGIEKTHQILEPLILSGIDEFTKRDQLLDAKSTLQQHCQKQGLGTPVYIVLEEVGPDHEKSFLVAAQIGKRRFAPSWGKTKKEAEQLAAHDAINSLLELPEN
jgi:ribonuclease-3